MRSFLNAYVAWPAPQSFSPEPLCPSFPSLRGRAVFLSCPGAVDRVPPCPRPGLFTSVCAFSPAGKRAPQCYPSSVNSARTVMLFNLGSAYCLRSEYDKARKCLHQVSPERAVPGPLVEQPAEGAEWGFCYFGAPGEVGKHSSTIFQA